MANVKLTKLIVKNVTDILKVDWTLEEACRYAGIAKQTHYNRIKQKKFYLDEKPIIFKWKTIKKKIRVYYEDECEKAKQYSKMVARNVVMSDIERWNSKLAMEFLTKRDPRYKDKLDINNQDGFEFDEEDLIDD